MSVFKLDSYYRKYESSIHFGSTTIEFSKDSINLCDGFEWDDSDGDRYIEGDDLYIIPSTSFTTLLSLISDQYKEFTILSEFENAEIFYKTLNSETEKLIFLSILNYYKKDSCFYSLLSLIQNNNIPYEDKSWRY